MIRQEGVCHYWTVHRDDNYPSPSEPVAKKGDKEKEPEKEAPKEKRERHPHDCICFTCSY